MKFKSAEADWNTSFVSQHVEGRNPGRAVARKLYRLGGTAWVYWTGCRSQTRFGRGRQMKRYLKFAASFWMSAFLVAGSMAIAQTTPTTKPKKKSGSSTTSPAPATTNSSSQTQSGTTTAPTTSSDTTSTTPAVTANVQQSGTTTPAPKMIVGPDKHMIPAPQM